MKPDWRSSKSSVAARNINFGLLYGMSPERMKRYAAYRSTLRGDRTPLQVLIEAVEADDPSSILSDWYACETARRYRALGE